MGDVIVQTGSHVVNVNITSNCNAFTSEKRFDKGLTIRSLKDKLELITGARSQMMTIQVFDHKDAKICDLNDDQALLGSYPVEESGMRLHVIDPERTEKFLDDTNGVAKYEMSPDMYAQRTGTVQDYLRKNKLGKYNPDDMKRIDEEKARLANEEKEKATAMKVGDRCEVKVTGNPTRRGEVRFVGEVHFKPGFWAGVKYDEPHGKNDGSVDGKRYFECEPKYGAFVKVTNVTVGDFPEEGFSDDEI